jgi:hypothetical protein
MVWVASTLHTTSEHGVCSITTADAHTSAASSQLNWRPRRFKWTRPFRRKTRSGFCACAVTFQSQSVYIGCLVTLYFVRRGVSSRPDQRKDWCLFMKECRESRQSKYFQIRATYLEIPGARYLDSIPTMKNVTFLL